MTAAMILAAGRGQRMRPLTDHTPKPLLTVQGRPLLQGPLDALLRDGCRQLVVNTDWLGDQIVAFFASLPSWDGHGMLLNQEHPVARVDVHLSHEGRDFGRALETAGGICRALPWLGDVFWVTAGDVHAPGFRFDPAAVARLRASDHLAHLWLVPNPDHHPGGDFGLGPDGLARNDAPVRHTFSTIALYRRALFAPPWCDIPAGNPAGVVAPLAPLLRRAVAAGRVGATLYTGAWTDVGTPERLARLNRAPAPDVA